MAQPVQSFRFIHAGCFLAIMLLCTLVNAEDPADVAKYYECKDARGKISFQQQPCSGDGVKETSKVLPTAKPINAGNNTAGGFSEMSVGSATNAITSVINATSHTSSQLAPLMQTPEAVVERFKQRLQTAKEQKPVVLVACLVLMLIAVWNAILLLYLAFRESVFWGLGYLFIPLVGLIYVVTHWDDAGKPFLISVGCGFLTGVISGVFL